MKNFGIGLSLGLIGAILWYIFRLVISLGEISSSAPGLQLQALEYASFTLMVGGPLVYWIILPITERVRRHKDL